MKQTPILIKKINQLSNHAFSIEWSDGVINKYNLSTLQNRCPCAKCLNANEKTPEKNLQDLRAKNIVNVGRYALRIQFTSGCSLGIYSYAFLRMIALENPSL